jgi:thiosulfate/3-mercaptopyruvate sulfurtransferase
LSAEAVQRSASVVRARFDPAEIVYTDTLQQIRGNVVLLDARAAPRFRGEVEPIDPVAGHIPGALNRPFSDNLAADGRFKPAAGLREEFSTLIAPNDARGVVHMCGSGVTACHNLLAMEHAGLHGSRIYAPSWSGWIADPSRPVERGTT